MPEAGAEPASDAALRRRFEAFIRRPTWPCVGAKSALAKGQLDVLVARDILSAWDDLRIHEALARFARGQARSPRLFSSFAVVFRERRRLDEAAFEAALWGRLQSLHDKDAWLGYRHDPGVSADPASPHFSWSLAGSAFFVVGLHAGASRPARRFPHPALVFNLHAQFETLRRQNRYEQLRRAILDRDVAFSGSTNPMLARHGEVSEARQYSGRAVDDGWACPFRPRVAAAR
jgi:hypothetical protein